MKELIKALNALDLSSTTNDEDLIRNLFKIGEVFHTFKMEKYLKNTNELSNFIINHINKEDNKILYIIGVFYLKNYVWLKSYLKTIYLRPDVKFLYKPLYYPEIKNAKDFKNIIGKLQLIQNPTKNYTSVCGKNDLFCLFDVDILQQTKQFLQDLNDYSYFNNFYIKLNKDFKDLIIKTNFNLIKTYNPLLNSIHLVLHDNGYVLGVYNSEIGNQYLFYIPLNEIFKLYKQARKEFDKNGSSVKFLTLQEIYKICNLKGWQLIHEDNNTYTLEDLKIKTSMVHGAKIEKFNTLRDVQIYFDKFKKQEQE